MADGIMCSSHHAIEDIAVLSGMQNANIWVPAFADEVEPALKNIVADAKPAYLRLGAGKTTPEGSTLSGSFKIIQQNAEAEMTIFALGPVANNVVSAVAQFPELSSKINVITAFHFPLILENDVINLVEKARNILVVEEHISIGGLAQQLSVQLLEKGLRLDSFKSLKAEGYPNSRYGSQGYHQKNFRFRHRFNRELYQSNPYSCMNKKAANIIISLIILDSGRGIFYGMGLLCHQHTQVGRPSIKGFYRYLCACKWMASQNCSTL